MKRLLYPLLFFLLAACVLEWGFSPLLREISLQSPFLATVPFALNVLACPAGVLTYVSAWLATWLVVPITGAVVLSLVLVTTAFCVRWCCRMSSVLEGFAWAVAVLMLSYTLGLGYLIYVMKVAAIGFSVPLGIALSALMAGIGVRLHGFTARLACVMLISTVGYYAIGFYALVALAVMAVASPMDWKISLLAVACGVIVPQVCYVLGFAPCLRHTLYIAGLPDLLWTVAAERERYYPLIVTVLLLFAWPVMQRVLQLLRPHVAVILSVAVVACSMVYTAMHTCRDANFNNIIQMKQAVDNEDWEEVLELSRQCSEEPTRLQVMFARLALFCLGKAGDEMFTLPDGDATYNASRPQQYMRLIGARALYMHYGKVNYAYRWCMEDMVEYGPRPDLLRYMYLASRLNGEEALSRHYARVIATCPHATVPVLSHEAEERIKAMMYYDDVLDGDGGMIERYLLSSFSTMEGGTRPMTEQALLCSMVCKDIHGFWQYFIPISRSCDGSVPRHYQEAALLFATLGGQVDVASLPIGDDVSQDFDRLVAASEANAARGDDFNAAMLRGEFGHTYWYYYFFVKGLKTN